MTKLPRYSNALKSVAVKMVANGMSTREVALKLQSTAGVSVSYSSILLWAKKYGDITWASRARLKPCPYCGSRTLHKWTCPIFKEKNPEGYRRPSVKDRLFYAPSE
jgi:DNA-directed RNA polymerase subunit RPC12/RpoP